MQRLNVSGDKDGVVVVMETSHRGNSPFTRQKGTWCVNMKGKGVKTSHRHLLYFTLKINAFTAVKLQLFFAVVAFNLETGSVLWFSCISTNFFNYIITAEVVL